MSEENQPPAKPPREFSLKHTWADDAYLWEVSGDYLEDDVEVHVIERSYADRLEQEIAFVKTQWKQTSDLLEQERNRLTAELADVRKELEKHRWRQVGAQVDPTPEAYAVLEAERDQALSQAAALAGALKKCIYDSERLEHGQWAVDQANEALAKYREWLKGRE